MTYRWDDNLREWWRNSAAGQPLVVEMALEGSLRAVQRGQAVAFLDAAGATAFAYDKLLVTDANGNVIPARLSLSQGERAGVRANVLRIRVDEARAAYPLTIDPLLQQATLKASNTDPIDLFDRAVAVSGDTVVVGAHYEDSSATGVDGNQADDSASDSDAGAAYVFDSCIASAQTGAWADTATWVGGVVPDAAGACILNGHTVTLGADAAALSVHVYPGGAFDLATYAFTAETIVTNQGALWQTQTVSNANVPFLHIQNIAATNTAYRGLDIDTTTSGADLGVTVVRVMGDTAVCNNDDGGAYRNRCFMANPANSGSASVTLYSTDNEDDILYDAFFQYASSTTWTQGATCDNTYGGGGSCTGAATFASPAYFLIGSAGSDPTAVTLRALAAEEPQPRSLNRALPVAVATGATLVAAALGVTVAKRRRRA
jgi:hypothetical protein